MDCESRGAVHLFESAHSVHCPCSARGHGTCPCHAWGRHGRARPEGIILIIQVLAQAGVPPAWTHNSGWSYRLSGGIGLVLLVDIILLVMGEL